MGAQQPNLNKIMTDGEQYETYLVVLKRDYDKLVRASQANKTPLSSSISGEGGNAIISQSANTAISQVGNKSLPSASTHRELNHSIEIPHIERWSTYWQAIS